MANGYPEHLHYIEVMCNSAFYGVYCVLVVVVLYLLYTRPKMPFIHKIMFWAGVFMWVLTTVQLGLVLQQVTVPVVPLANARAQVCIAIVQFMIGDSILIWRVYTVWSSSWLMTAIPIGLMIAAAGTRIPIVVSPVKVRAFVSDTAATLIVVNVGLCTLLIAGRIWYLQWQIGKVMDTPSSRTYKAVLLMLIESGALYFIAQLLAVILSKIHNNGVHTVLDIQVPLIGILPTMIVLLVHLDMVPGTRVQTEYTTMGRISFRKGPRPKATEVSLTTDVELATTTKIDEDYSRPGYNHGTVNFTTEGTVVSQHAQ